MFPYPIFTFITLFLFLLSSFFAFSYVIFLSPSFAFLSFYLSSSLFSFFFLPLAFFHVPLSHFILLQSSLLSSSSSPVFLLSFIFFRLLSLLSFNLNFLNPRLLPLCSLYFFYICFVLIIPLFPGPPPTFFPLILFFKLKAEMSDPTVTMSLQLIVGVCLAFVGCDVCFPIQHEVLIPWNSPPWCEISRLLQNPNFHYRVHKSPLSNTM